MRHRQTRIIAIAFAVALMLGIAGASGCSADESTNGDGAVTGAAQEATQSGSNAYEPTTSEEGTMHVSDVKVTGEEIAVITTSRGVIKFKFYPKDAPNHVASFIELARAGFYDGTKFHRVEPGFVIQGGDPYSKTGAGPVGTGGPGYSLKAEFNDRPHIEGTVAMARSQSPDSAGSQFYICLAPASFLDGQYTVFGQVIEGMDVVKATQVGDVMESVRIEDGK